MEFEAYLDALASADPTPGGGSAATLVGALAAALCAMVARVTMSTPKLAPLHEEAAAVAEDADDLRRRFMELRPKRCRGGRTPKLPYAGSSCSRP